MREAKTKAKAKAESVEIKIKWDTKRRIDRLKGTMSYDEFLTRLTEEWKKAEGKVERVLKEIAESGLVNMLEVENVAYIAEKLGHPDVSSWILVNKEEYHKILKSLREVEGK